MRALEKPEREVVYLGRLMGERGHEWGTKAGGDLNR